MTGGGSSIPEVQQLLAVLAAGRRAAEVGTAFGDAAAATASTAASLVTVEVDEERAESARTRLAGLPNVELHVGDWRDVLPPRGPFDLVFVDSGDAAADPAVAGLVAVGGLVVKRRPDPGTPRARSRSRVLDGPPRLRRRGDPDHAPNGALVAARVARRTPSSMPRR